MVNPLEITYYVRTGYSTSDEPANDAVIEMNEHWIAPLRLKEYDPSGIQELNVQLSDDDLHKIDYMRIKDTITAERWYYYVIGHRRINTLVVALRIALDAFATVGLANISFFGNIARRSLSASEAERYPLLPEPWAPRRPLKTRRIVIDLNVNKTAKIPSHISTTFEEITTEIEDKQTINVPNSPIGLTALTDNLSISASIPMGYPNAAKDTSHTINTPWGNIQYTTPREEYLTLSGAALTTFLAKAKKYNALDLIEPAYYLPAPSSMQNIRIDELSNPNTRNPKASRYYTTVTIRALASNSARTYTDNDTDLQYNQSLTVVIVPDKNGGIYVIPTTIRDTGLSAYTYLEGVYSPFETVQNNAVGDTPAKFAADGTNILNTALNNLYQTYIGKVNALQYEGMQAKYFMDMVTSKTHVLAFAAEALGLISSTVTTTEAYDQIASISTNVPTVSQSSTQTQSVPQISQSIQQNTAIPSNTVTQDATTSMPKITGTQSSSTDNASHNQTQQSHTVSVSGSTGNMSYPSIITSINAFRQTSSGTTSQDPHTIKQTTKVSSPYQQHQTSGTTTIPSHNISTSASTTTYAHTQESTQSTRIPTQTTRSTTTQDSASRSVEDGNKIAIDGVPFVFTTPAYGGGVSWNTLQTMIFGGYRNEVHSFMLGNINDHLNRWVSLQNDMHNGKVANLFKNITLVGNYSDYNRLVGKYEILIASLQPEDEINFDLFLDHFGHAVDEYTNTLVADVRDNYNYTLVGEDAIIANGVMQEASARILNQFRTGVRVWKKPIRPENY